MFEDTANRSCTLLAIFAEQDRVQVTKLIQAVLPGGRSSGLRLIDVGHDLLPGDDKEVALRQQLSESDGVLLFLTQSFLNDEALCMSLSAEARQRWPQQAPPILPLLIRPCAWQTTFLRHLRPFSPRQKALRQQSNTDSAKAELIEYVHDWIVSQFPWTAPWLGIELGAESQYRQRIAETLRAKPYWIEPLVQIPLLDPPAPPQLTNEAPEFDLRAEQAVIRSPDSLVRTWPIVAFGGGHTSGKTTLLYALGLRAAERGVISSSNAMPDTAQPGAELLFLPVLARLREMTPRAIDPTDGPWSLIALLAEHLGKQLHANPKELYRLFRRALWMGRLLILMDDLDSARDELRWIERAVVELIDQFPIGNRVVITSAAAKQFSEGFSAQRAVILSLSTVQTERFLCRAVHSANETAHLPARRTVDERQLQFAIVSHPGIQTLLANPLMLKIWIAIRSSTFEQSIKGNDRATLLHQYVDERLHHYAKAVESSLEKISRTKRNAEHVLEHLALYFLDSGVHTAVSRSRLQHELVATLLQSPAEKRAERAIETDVALILGHGPGLSHLLIEAQDGALAFEHAVFLWYFAASALVRMSAEQRWSRIQPQLRNPLWREPIILCISILANTRANRPQASLLINQIIEEGRKRGAAAQPELLLALAAVLESQSILDQVPPALVSQLQECLNLKLPSVRQQAMAGLVELARLGVMEARALVEEMASLSNLHPEFILALKRLVDTEPFGPVEKQLRALSGHASPAVQAAAIVALESAVRRDPDLRAKLIPCLDSQEEAVLRAGFKVLMPLFSQADDIRPQLESRLIASNPRAVAAGLTSLHDEQLSDAAIRQILTERLRDQPPHVRIQLLAQLLPLALIESQALATLLAALRDSNFTVREGVFSSLCYLSRFDLRIRDAVLGHIDATWPAFPPEIPPQLCSVYILFIRFMNLRDPWVWQKIRPKLRHPDAWVREAFIKALASWVEHLPELQDDLWAMVHDDNEATTVRQAALVGLLPVVSHYPEMRPLLERRMAGQTNEKAPPYEAMLWAIDTLACIDEPTKEWLDAQRKQIDQPRVKTVYLSLLYQASPNREDIRKELLSLLQSDDANVALTAWLSLAGTLDGDSLQLAEVQAFLAAPNIWLRREAILWLVGLRERTPQVRKALQAQLASNDLLSFSRALFKLLASNRSDVEMFVVCARALQRFNAAQSDPLRSIHPDLLAFFLLRHRHQESILEQLHAQNSTLADRLRQVLPQLRALMADPARLLAETQQSIELIPSEQATARVMSSFVWGRLAKRFGRDPSTGPGRHLGSANPRLQAEAMGALMAANPKDMGVKLLAQLEGPSAADDTRILSTLMLGNLRTTSPDVVKVLRLQLAAPNPMVRLAALKSLIPLANDNREIASWLIPWLGVYTEGAEDMGVHVRIPDAVPWSGPALRREIASAIASHLSEGTELCDQIVAMLAASAWPARQGAAWALSMMPGGPSEMLRKQLRRLISDPRNDDLLLERLQAARALNALPVKSRSDIEATQALAEEGLAYGLAPWHLAPFQGAACRQAAVHLYAALPSAYRLRSVLQQRAEQDPSDAVRELANHVLNAA